MVSGQHRFYSAKAVGVDRFPLKVVGVHDEWVKRCRGNNRGSLKGDIIGAIKGSEKVSS